MTTDKEILDQFLGSIQREIIANSETQGRNASGAAKDGLRVETDQSNGKLIDGEGYTQWGWEYGRAPGKMPPRDAIEQWIEDKGIIPTDISKKSLAFLIARKIGESGTSLFLSGAPSGVITGVITRPRLDSLRVAFGSQYATKIKTEIIRMFQ